MGRITLERVSLPFSLPIKPMLAAAASELPVGDGWIYQPKWDGFRGLVVRRQDGVQIWSRNGKRLDGYFPELCSAMANEVLGDTVLDGEIVIVREGALDFEALLARLAKAPRAAAAAALETPATFVAFDLLADVGADLRRLPLAVRRQRLEGLVGRSEWMVATPETEDAAAAQGWYVEFGARGFEGVVAKRAEERYREGGRSWRKVRWRRTVDVVLGGYSGRRLLLGMYGRGGVLHYVGATTPLGGEWTQAAAAVRQLKEQAAFVGGVTPGMGRFEEQRLGHWTEVEPRLVLEVVYDQVSGRRFRHPVRFMRWRPDKDPGECLRADIDKPSLGVLPPR